MRSFRSDWREAYVISNSYGMGDPLAFRFEETERTAEGGRHHPSVTVLNDQAGRLGTEEKIS
jgi:hypothetical protein